jgi:sigma-E factor negative regulatory protein RseB
MSRAAQAAVSTSYTGEEWDIGGGTTLVSDIWHSSGGQTKTQTLAAGTGASNQPYVSTDPMGNEPEGVLGVTMTLVQLLETHYVVCYAGTASASKRAAQVVEAWRSDGSLAARFWIDTETSLPLERQVFDPSAHITNEDYFNIVRIGTSATPPPSSAGGPVASTEELAPAAQASGQPAWSFPIARAKLLAFGQAGWKVPAALPDGLTLFTGGVTSLKSGIMLDLSYSDGLYVVTLFEQRGKLAAKLAGWQRTMVGGRAIYTAEPAQRLLTWAGGGVVYTVIADAPSPTVAKVVKTLPYDKPPGFWKRMSRGLSRLASLMNPFR